MIEHILKCHPVYFDAIERGEKTFEIRRDDRAFQKGDTLILQRTREDRTYEVEWPFDHITPPGARVRAKREIAVKVLWILTGGQFGVEPGFVCMSVERIPHDPR